MANSLSARTAIRAAANDRRVSHLVCLVGVVNLRHTLHQVYCDDLVGGHLTGRKWGVGDMLGVEMDYDTFLHSAVQENMHELAGTHADLLKTAAKISFYAAERDNWVLLADVDAAMRGLPNAQLTPIPGAMHELRENAQVAEQAFRMIVTACAAHVQGVSPEAVVLQQPDKRQLLQQNRVERERLRQVSREKDSEPEFWAKYLAKYRLLQNVDDYQSYVSLVGRLLGPIKSGEIILDAGCGNGLFGLWVVRALLEQAALAGALPPVYIGLDLTVEGLRDAIDIQSGYGLGHIRTTGERLQQFVSMLYAQTDLDTWGMPSSEAPGLVVFADNCFDKICCSLVLSYLNRPQIVLAELYRVLKPGASIVVSSMKPFCDMSEIYRDFMSQQVSATELESGRDLLRAAGKIRIKEEQGYYTFFSGEELTVMLSAAGFKKSQTHLSFGGQAVVVAAEK
jgi:ubiquinone/menaquinone biosynthesis C-methylase UbiE